MSRDRTTYHPAFRPDEVIDEELHLHSAAPLTGYEVRQALFALCDHLGLTLRRTNNTKHGDLQILIVDPAEGL